MIAPASVLSRSAASRSAASRSAIVTTAAFRKRAQNTSCRPFASASTSSSAISSNKAEGGEGLSTLGTLFFGSLCVGTFGLGCWQSQRYFEKIDQMAVREEELRAEPVPLTRFTVVGPAASSAGEKSEENQRTTPSFRRQFVSGQFDHTREVLVGPRGPPPGALSSKGPTSGRSGGGMASSPQGYYVVTPLRISNTEQTVLVNRGWVPLSYVKQNAGTWSRPSGEISIVGVETRTEHPKFLSPQHDRRTPNMLLWMDRVALEDITQTKGRNPLLITETADVEVDSSGSTPPTFPIKPTADTVGEFKVTPITHGGYAATWFGLSGAGLVMTRKLLTRGR